MMRCLCGLVVAAAGVAAQTSQELVWEPVPMRDYCNALPRTRNWNNGRWYDPVYNEDNGACQREIGATQGLSPNRYYDYAQGKLTAPAPKTLTCPDTGAQCDGVIDMDLSAHNEITFVWQSGAQQGSSFTFLPPIGAITAVAFLESAQCNGAQQTAGTLQGRCEAVDLLDDWRVKDPYKMENEGMTMGSIPNMGTGLRFYLDLFTFRGGSVARIQKFGIKCTYNPAVLPAQCSGMQEWTFGFKDALAGGIGAQHNEQRQKWQLGVSILHPFDKPQLQIQQGFPTPEDPCLNHGRQELCALDLYVTPPGTSMGPCAWNGTACNAVLAPEMTCTGAGAAPEDTSIVVADAQFAIEIMTWTKLDRVLGIYYTVGTNGDPAPEPMIPDADVPASQDSHACGYPCTYAPPSVAEGVYEFKFVAHLEASMAGKFRQVFLSAVGTRTYTIGPDPTPPPTPSPPLPPGTQQPPTPGPPTPEPPTPEPPTPQPPTPIPTPLPLLTDPPVPPPTPTPPQPNPGAVDGCRSFGENECKTPCLYQAYLQACGFNDVGPVIRAVRQRDCLQVDPTDDRCDRMRIAPEESIPITYNPVTHYNYTVSAIRYMKCTKDDMDTCRNLDDDAWVTYPYAADDTTSGIKIPQQNCGTDEDCRQVVVIAVADIVVYTSEVPETLTTLPTERQFFIQDETLPPTPEPEPPTPAPIVLRTLEPLAAAEDSTKSAPTWLIIAFLLFIGCICCCMFFVAYTIWKRGEAQYEDDVDEMDEDEMDNVDGDNDDDDDEFEDTYQPPAKKGGKAVDL
eukprot:TRINITY_DN1159_c0_g1_i1.p1 TRINITY_DN1159_c0_g1~~TRINITY_DN1159_c0_g1_i1.p1  ORF type:complete len:789 (+),score=238.43 TRINITY_DN1159_c0_g1_i1:70-2436(+)